MTKPRGLAASIDNCRCCLAVTETTVNVNSTAREVRQYLRSILEFNSCFSGVANLPRETSRGYR